MASSDRGLRAMRKSIDGLDRGIVRLLAKRFALAGRLAPLKRRVRAPQRERTVLAHVARCAREYGVEAAIIRSVYRKLMSESRRCQQRFRGAAR